MEYKIVNFYPEEGKLEVFYSDKLSNLFVDVPINSDGLFITGQELHEYIKGFIPTWHLERLEKLQEGVSNVNEIANLVEVMPSAQDSNIATEEVTKNAEMWREVQFEQSVAKALVKFGVLESDPTAIPVTNQ
jgi:hypothetical protein